MKTSAVDSKATPSNAMDAQRAKPVTQPQRRLKIAVLNRVFAPTGGGAERYSIALVEQLAARHEVHVFAQEINHQWPGVHYHPIACWFKKPRWLNQLWYAFATQRAIRSIEGAGFDIVHSHENVWHGNVHTMHVKTVQRSLFEGLSGSALWLRRIKIALSPRLLTYLKFERARLQPRPGLAVVAASQPLQAELLDQYPHLANVISTITPGVTMPTQRLTQQQARAALGVPAQGQYIAFIANDYDRKGLPTLLKSLQGLPDVRLLVVGNASQIPQFKAKAQSLSLDKRVYFLGPLSDVSPVYFAANVLAHPTLEDTFAMVVLEAMAHGLPVVVSGSEFCGISALLTHSENALLLSNPQYATELQAALHAALRSHETGSQLALAGLKFAEQHSWQAAACNYEEVFYSCVAVDKG
jgi:glycosyltransferase involved in cell wall biosynthesis